MADAGGEVTTLLRAWRAGDDDAYRQVSAILYDELKRHASFCLRGHQPAEALQTTALVHEAFVRLVSAGEVDWQDRRHFINVAARTMRRVLVDLVRAHGATKRGSRAVHVPLDSGIGVTNSDIVDLVALDEALGKLAAFDARKAQVVELRFFGGLTVEEAAQVLDVSPDTVARDWRVARSWLARELDPAS